MAGCVHRSGQGQLWLAAACRFNHHAGCASSRLDQADIPLLSHGRCASSRFKILDQLAVLGSSSAIHIAIKITATPARCLHDQYSQAVECIGTLSYQFLADLTLLLTGQSKRGTGWIEVLEVTRTGSCIFEQDRNQVIKMHELVLVSSPSGPLVSRNPSTA